MKPFNMITLQTDEASVSADMKTYTDPKYMVRAALRGAPLRIPKLTPSRPVAPRARTPTRPRAVRSRSLPARAGTTRATTSVAASTCSSPPPALRIMGEKRASRAPRQPPRPTTTTHVPKMPADTASSLPSTRATRRGRSKQSRPTALALPGTRTASPSCKPTTVATAGRGCEEGVPPAGRRLFFWADCAGAYYLCDTLIDLPAAGVKL